MFPIQAQFNWLIALGWLGLAAVGFLLSRANRGTQFWALWFFVCLLPVLQIVPFPIWVADRYLYIPLVGGLMLVSRFLFGVLERLPRPSLRWALQTGVLAAVFSLAWKTHAHLPVWRDDLTLWEATTPTCIKSPYCNMELGLTLLQNGQTERGMRALIRSVELGGRSQMLERLGDAYTLTAQDYRQAVIAYQMAAGQEGPRRGSEIHGKLARVHYLSGNLDAAKEAVEQGKQLSPTDPGVWIANGFVLWKEGKWDEARVSLRRALALAGGTPNSARFFTEFMGRPAEVGQILADLRSSQDGPPSQLDAR
jgi:tetratricopeptide (TPR) repeat protein